jgi:GTP-binding protein Era
MESLAMTQPSDQKTEASVIDAFFAKAGAEASKPDAANAPAGLGGAEAAAAAEDEAEALPSGPPRCGQIAIVGRPNVGKSTLLNALVGQKVSITSRKAQTTRHRITGVRTAAANQYIFVDTPGFQTRHSNALNKNLNKAVTSALTDVDVVVLVVEAGNFTLGDAKVLALLPQDTPVLLLANKLDQIKHRADLMRWLKDMQTRFPFAEIVPLSAKKPADMQRLLGILAQYLPEQEWLYQDGQISDKSERFLVAEIVREKLFRLSGDELPYTSTVIVEQFEEEVLKTPQPGMDRFCKIAAAIIVERDSHKAMIIGEGGEKLKRIGSEARQDLERLLGAKVHLQLWVKVQSGWADNAAKLRAYGYE